MGGRPAVKIYQYDSSGKFLKCWQTQAEMVRAYGFTQGNIFPNGNIRQLPDGTYISRERVGREVIKRMNRIFNSKYSLSQERNFNTIYVYNYEGERIATFVNARIASMLLGVSTRAIYLQCNRGSNAPKGELNFSYE